MLQEFIKLFVNTSNAPPWNCEWTIEKATKMLMTIVDTPGFLGFIGKKNQKIIAACFGGIKPGWNMEWYNIDEFFVDTEYQNTGKGTTLINGIKEELRKRKIDTISVHTWEGFSVTPFYEKNGFNKIDNNILMVAKF